MKASKFSDTPKALILKRGNEPANTLGCIKMRAT